MTPARQLVGGRVPRERWYPAGDPVSHERMVTLAGGERTRVIEAGAADAPPILLLHGWACAAYSWHRVIPPLAGEGYRVIAPELRGHGGSDKPADPRAYTLDALRAQVTEVLDVLGVERVALAAGHSMGNAVLASLATTAPGLIPRLLLVAPVRLVRVPLRRLAAFATPALLTGVLPSLVPRTVGSIALRLATGGGGGRIEPAQLDQYWAPSADPGFVRALRHLLHEFPWEPMPDEMLRALPRATSVVLGESDRLVHAARAMRRLAAVRPDIPVRTVPGSGHIVAEQAPAVVLEVMRELLRRESA